MMLVLFFGKIKIFSIIDLTRLSGENLLMSIITNCNLSDSRLIVRTKNTPEQNFLSANSNQISLLQT